MIEETIRKLLVYAKAHLGLDPEDETFLENQLLHHYGKQAPYVGAIDEKAIEALTVPDSLIDEIVSYDTDVLSLDTEEALRDADWVLGFLSPRPSEVNRLFWEKQKQNDRLAMDYLYDLSIHNGYFQKTKVDQNEMWMASFPNGSDLCITINLSKPEKNNKDIAKLLTKVSSDYPKCRLCPTNLGYYGDAKHPARSSLRFVPMTLAGEKWYFQYSPYGYFTQHGICLQAIHTPMHIERKTFERLFDFIDLFPSFFMGSNSDLPIVGGSILDHEHFQGGLPLLPIFHAKDRRLCYQSAKGSKIYEVDFYDTALKLEGNDREDLVMWGEKILNAWLPYSDLSCEIIGKEGDVRHNAITSIARKQGQTYTLYLLLRNNRTNEQYPDGIFHAHPEYFSIKKEGIGLIEAAGLFILPARLKRQLAEAEISAKMEGDTYLEAYPDMKDFSALIASLRQGKSAHDYVNQVCRGILENVAVFKATPEGEKGLDRFLQTVFRE